MQRSFYRFLLDSGYPEDQIYGHDSDLYIEENPETTKLLDGWLSENGFSSLRDCTFMVDHFVDQITGKPMFDVAFQYEPYWGKIKRG